MPTVSKQLNRIIERTNQLVDLCVTLQEQNDMLKLENQSLEVALETGKEKIKTLEEKVESLAVAKTLQNSDIDDSIINEKNLDIKQKIDDFVQEIDKCILLLK